MQHEEGSRATKGVRERRRRRRTCPSTPSFTPLPARKRQERQNCELYFSLPAERFPLCSHRSPMSGSYYRSLYPFSGDQHQQGLSFDAGEIIRVVQALPGGWWEGERDGHRGWFPSSYVQILEVSTPIDVYIET